MYSALISNTIKSNTKQRVLEYLEGDEFNTHIFTDSKDETYEFSPYMPEDEYQAMKRELFNSIEQGNEIHIS